MNTLVSSAKLKKSLPWHVNFGSELLRVTLDGHVACISCLPPIQSKKGYYKRFCIISTDPASVHACSTLLIV